MDTIEIQRNAGHRRTVAHMIRLIRIDRLHSCKCRVPDNEIAAHFAHARLFQGPCQLRKVIGAQRRITAPCQDQIPMQNPAAQLSISQNPGCEPMLGAKNVQRIKRRQSLGNAGRRQTHLASFGLKPFAAFHVRNRAGNLALQSSPGQQRIQIRNGTCGQSRLASQGTQGDCRRICQGL